jgi:CheY-specific phosphatase CheX
MAVKFFGQFLVEKGLITRENLLKALELQQSTNLRFGEMAHTMGFLTYEDIENIHRVQLTDDLRFGAAAEKLGLLTPEQVQQVSTRQSNSYLYIGRALVETGALDPDRLEIYLQQFQSEQAPYRMDRIEIPLHVPHSGLWEVSADLTCKMLTRVAQLPHRAEQCRTVGRLEPNDVIAVIDIAGTARGRYILSASSGIQETLARAILKAESVSEEPREVLDDTLGEFANIVCGNMAAKGGQLGYHVEIAPPAILRPEAPLEVPRGYVGFLFPIHIVSGERLELALFVQT